MPSKRRSPTARATASASSRCARPSSLRLVQGGPKHVPGRRPLPSGKGREAKDALHQGHAHHGATLRADHHPRRIEQRYCDRALSPSHRPFARRDHVVEVPTERARATPPWTDSESTARASRSERTRHRAAPRRRLNPRRFSAAYSCTVTNMPNRGPADMDASVRTRPDRRAPPTLDRGRCPRVARRTRPPRVSTRPRTRRAARVPLQRGVSCPTTPEGRA
jgi:hypothetical protein